MAMKNTLDLGEVKQPLLVFGGAYSNRQATQALLAMAAARKIPPQRVICTGDVVAYCGEPDETVDLIRDWGVHVLQGNCEQALAMGAEDCGCGFAAGSTCDSLTSGWYPYAIRNVSEENKAWMRDLPTAIRFHMGARQFLVVHGGVTQNNRFIFYSTALAEKRAELAKAGADVVIGGHCGIPFGQFMDDKLWLNAGAIGMPANDGTRDAWYMLLQPRDGELRVSWQRLRYDAQGAFAAMQAVGQSTAYAEALLSGHWPSLDVLPEAERRQQGRPLALPEMVFPLQVGVRSAV